MHAFRLAAGLAALLALPAAAQDTIHFPMGESESIARAMREMRRAEGLSDAVKLKSGPDGTILLGQFAQRNDPDALFVGGYGLIGTAIARNALASLRDLTPIARLTGDYQAVAVPAGSGIDSIAALLDRLKADPRGLRFVGEPMGSASWITTAKIAEAAGADIGGMSYGNAMGRSGVLGTITTNGADVAVASLATFQRDADAGLLRILAVAAPEPLAGAPTLQASGVDAVVQDWQMVAAAPGISAERKAEITAGIARMAQSAAWRDALARDGMQGDFLAGPEWDAQLLADQAMVASAMPAR